MGHVDTGEIVDERVKIAVMELLLLRSHGGKCCLRPGAVEHVLHALDHFDSVFAAASSVRRAGKLCGPQGTENEQHQRNAHGVPQLFLSSCRLQRSSSSDGPAV